MIGLVAFTFALFLGPAMFGMDLWELCEKWFGPDSVIYLNLFFAIIGVIGLLYAIIRTRVALINTIKDLSDR